MKHLLRISSLFFGLLAWVMTVEAMTIQLVKGNRWEYSYETLNTDSGGNSIVVSSYMMQGILFVTIDSVKSISGSNDTTFFRLGIIDSGETKSTENFSYNYKYSKHFSLYNDTLISLDNNKSPGFNTSLAYYPKTHDLPSFFIDYEGNTDTSTIMIDGKNVTVLSRNTHGWRNYTREKYDIYDTVQWIPEIGTVIYSLENHHKSYATGYQWSRSLVCYTLVSFNDMTIPPIPKPGLQARWAIPEKINKSVTAQKQIFLTVNGASKHAISNAMYYSLRGQKVYGNNCSQVCIGNNLTKKNY